MKNRAIFPSIATLITLLLIPIVGFSADAVEKKVQVAGMVRTLGYGGAIHNFKNYVLRGAEKYHAGATARFGEAKKFVAALESVADEAETVALKDIAGVIDQYEAALSTVREMHLAGKSVKEIDAAVKISDKPAVEGLKTLRASASWSDLEQAEYALGYGNAIHQFKNYVIRGAEKHGVGAAERFDEAKGALKKMSAEGGAAVENVVGVIDAYVAALPAIQGMVAEGKTAEEVDTAVKISDKPAMEGLAHLRGE